VKRWLRAHQIEIALLTALAVMAATMFYALL
jgi:hypothetical protein